MELFEELLRRYPVLESCAAQILQAQDMMLNTYRRGGKILICGNGGSCADADHMVGELMKGFRLRRPMDEAMQERFRTVLGENAQPLIQQLQCGIPAVSLPGQSGVLTAFINDVQPELMYAQLVFACGKEPDLFVGLSTSGNSANVVAAAQVSKVLGLPTLALTGAKESRLSEICDCVIRVPETETFKVQELHLPVYHYLCASVEQSIFG